MYNVFHFFTRHLRSLSVCICLCSLLTIMTSGCQPSPQYHSYQQVGPSWENKDTLSFLLPHSLTLPGTYSLEIDIRHTIRYPYRDIWLALSRPAQPDLPADTFHLYLSDEEGNWKGNGKTLIQYVQTVGTIRLQEADSILQLTHLMKENPLEEVSDIGICLLPLTGSIDTQKDEKQDGESPQG